MGFGALDGDGGGDDRAASDGGCRLRTSLS